MFNPPSSDSCLSSSSLFESIDPYNNKTTILVNLDKAWVSSDTIKLDAKSRDPSFPTVC